MHTCIEPFKMDSHRICMYLFSSDREKLIYSWQMLTIQMQVRGIKHPNSIQPFVMLVFMCALSVSILWRLETVMDCNAC